MSVVESKVRISLISLNLLAALAAAAAFVVMIVKLLTFSLSPLTPTAFYVGAILITAFCAINSLLCIYAAYKMRLCLFYFHIVSTVLLMCGTAILCYFSSAEQSSLKIYSRFDAGWGSMSSIDRIKIQIWGQCCGYASYEDRIENPCTSYQQQVGCIVPIIPLYKRSLNTIFIVSLAMAAVQLFIALFAVQYVIRLRKSLSRDKRSRRGSFTPKDVNRLPIDEWATAVL